MQACNSVPCIVFKNNVLMIFFFNLTYVLVQLILGRMINAKLSSMNRSHVKWSMHSCPRSIDPTLNDRCIVVVDQLILDKRSIDTKLCGKILRFHLLCLKWVIFNELEWTLGLSPFFFLETYLYRERWRKEGHLGGLFLKAWGSF